MLELIKSFFSGLSRKEEPDNSSEKEAEETKKCKRCLMRIGISHNSCPHCRSTDFIY
ncbi:MAG: hypothetical protein LBI28_07080 [Treponema sp.]|nr:hypothetical protein [Treponema sp.]